MPFRKAINAINYVVDQPIVLQRKENKAERLRFMENNDLYSLIDGGFPSSENCSCEEMLPRSKTGTVLASCGAINNLL